VALHRRRGIDVEGCSDRVGELGKRDILAVDDAALELEMVHRRALFSFAGVGCKEFR